VLFDHAWRTIGRVVPAFIEARYPQTWSIMEVPLNEARPKALTALALFSV